jgi:hypothetical protein
MLTFLTGSDPNSWVSLVDALITFLVAVAAVTPTDKDDGVVSRIANVWGTFFSALSKR